MVWKIALTTAAALVGVNAVTTNYTSNTDPTQITLPDIPQVKSNDPATECVFYSSPYAINAAEWPTVWGTATTNGMNNSAEFKALYNSIDWTGVPKINPSKLDAATGGLSMAGYDTVADPNCWWSASQCTKPKAANVNADIYECAEPDVWGLTFDDGPNCSHNAFYDYLQTNSLKASMFYIGSNVVNWPYGALRGVKDGHHIAGHTWSHQLMTTLTNEEVLAELYFTQKAIKWVTGLTPKYWRPAQGDIDDRVRWIATQLNLTAIIWNLDTDDWAANVIAGVTTDTVNKNYEDFIQMGSNGTFDKSGNIVLSHEINNMTMDFFIDHFPAIKKSYTHVLDVATCMNITNPYFENTVTFPTFDQVVGTSSPSASSGSSGSSTKSGSSSQSTATTVKSSTSGSNSVYNTFNGALFIAALFGLLVLA